MVTIVVRITIRLVVKKYDDDNSDDNTGENENYGCVDTNISYHRRELLITITNKSGIRHYLSYTSARMFFSLFGEIVSPVRSSLRNMNVQQEQRPVVSIISI